MYTSEWNSVMYYLTNSEKKKKYKLEEIYDLKKGSHAKGSTAYFYLFRLQLNLYKEKITQKWFTIKVILQGYS